MSEHEPGRRAEDAGRSHRGKYPLEGHDAKGHAHAKLTPPNRKGLLLVTGPYLYTHAPTLGVSVPPQVMGMY